MKNTSDQPIYAICHTDETVFHCVEVAPGQTIDTGLAVMKTYTTKALLETDILAQFSSLARDVIHGKMNRYTPWQ